MTSEAQETTGQRAWRIYEEAIRPFVDTAFVWVVGWVVGGWDGLLVAMAAQTLADRLRGPSKE